jgi:hypothetical protein
MAYLCVGLVLRRLDLTSRKVAATPGLDRSDIEEILVFGGDVTGNGLPATTGWWLAIDAPPTPRPR